MAARSRTPRRWPITRRRTRRSSTTGGATPSAWTRWSGFECNEKAPKKAEFTARYASERTRLECRGPTPKRTLEAILLHRPVARYNSHRFPGLPGLALSRPIVRSQCPLEFHSVGSSRPSKEAMRELSKVFFHLSDCRMSLWYLLRVGDARGERPIRLQRSRSDGNAEHRSNRQ
jgi:hypothetical protein